MWLSLNIINDIVDISGLSPEDIAHRLTMSTAEIEGIEYSNQHLKTVITAKIDDVLPHPNADKLTLVDLDTGNEKIRVVCGAPNHKKGDIVALATVGTRFSEEFEVKATKIRGEKSAGMLCSEKELGISDDHSGIMILPADTTVGIPFSEMLPNLIDVKLDIDNKSLTHRPDLWCHTGFAREIAAIFEKKMSTTVDYSIEDSYKDEEKLTVTIKNPEASPRYCGLVVKNIKIAESPGWLKAKVTSIGMRPINNIVDITNFVMAEIGEPMHAFDRKKLKGDEIIVRLAKKGEAIKTLDGESHKLTDEDIIIADKGGPIALAGVMGGADSEIDENTTEIVLEAANFNPVIIRRTAGRYNLRTEAAVRFEKSLDPELCQAAIDRCFMLIKQLIPEAEAVTPIVDTYPVKPEKITINTSTDFIRKRIGDDIPDDRIIKILGSLDFKINNKKGALTIDVPSYRATGDIAISEDIVEEVGRIYGYGNITPKAPLTPGTTPAKNEKRLFERKIKEILSRDHHLIEVSNYSFLGEDLINRLDINEDKELRLQNPLSQEQDRLRRSLIPNIVTNIELNQRYHDSFKIFELGRIFLKDDRKSKELVTENTFVSGAVYSKNPDHPLFYDAKNIVIDLLDQLKIKNPEFTPAQKGLPPYAHPARSLDVSIGKKSAGLIFEVHPKVIEKFGIKGHAAMFDLNAELFLNCKKIPINFSELQKFPDVPFEISVLADKNTYIAEILSIIEKSDKEYVRSTDVISIYEGNPIPEGMKSISIRIVFAAKEKTLSPEDVDSLQKKVIERLTEKGYKLR